MVRSDFFIEIDKTWEKLRPIVSKLFTHFCRVHIGHVDSGAIAGAFNPCPRCLYLSTDTETLTPCRSSNGILSAYVCLFGLSQRFFFILNRVLFIETLIGYFRAFHKREREEKNYKGISREAKLEE